MEIAVIAPTAWTSTSGGKSCLVPVQAQAQAPPTSHPPPLTPHLSPPTPPPPSSSKSVRFRYCGMVHRRRVSDRSSAMRFERRMAMRAGTRFPRVGRVHGLSDAASVQASNGSSNALTHIHTGTRTLPLSFSAEKIKDTGLCVCVCAPVCRYTDTRPAAPLYTDIHPSSSPPHLLPSSSSFCS